jgi:hypothetical protein
MSHARKCLNASLNHIPAIVHLNVNQGYQMVCYKIKWVNFGGPWIGKC